MSYLKENKVKSILYLIFIGVWIYAQYFKGLYVTQTIYGDISKDINIIIFINILTIFFFLVFICFRGFKTILIIVSFIFSCIALGDVLYSRYYSIPLSISLIDQITLLNSLSESVASLILVEDFILFADVVTLLLLSIFLKKFTFNIGYGYRLVSGFVLVILFFNMSVLSYDNHYTERYVYNKREIGQDLGVYIYHYLDIRQGISNKISAITPISEEDLNLIKNANRINNKKTKYTGILEGKNVVVIQLEAFQNFVINEEFNGIEITPNLNKLINKNSIYASNMYYETAGGNTVDAELLANTSMLPTLLGSAYYLYPSNNYIAMSSILKEKGYATNSFHAYENTFWNREVMYKNLSYDKFYSIKDFDYNEEDIKGWSLNDEKFLKDSIDKTLEVAGDEKFYSYMITLSSHYPYEGFYNGKYTWSLGRTEGEVPLFERYLNALQYVDSAIGEFVEYLKEKEVYDDTVIVIFGDHGGLYNDEKIDMANMLGKEPTNQLYAKLETVPFIIHNSSIEKSILIDEVMGQKDIMPTLANLMNIKIPYSFGTNILQSDYSGVAIKRYGNIYTNDFIYLANEAQFYDFNTLEIVKDSSLIEKYLKVVLENHNILKANDLVYKYDYLRKYLED